MTSGPSEVHLSKTIHPLPFLKWAGGKRAILPTIRNAVGMIAPGARYFEPFLGGGAVYFDLASRFRFSAFLSDLNEPLMVTYQVVKSKLEDLRTELYRSPAPATSVDYYRLRNDFNALLRRLPNLNDRDSVRLAAQLILLNHSCYNGLYRTNLAGEFNVPFGGHDMFASIPDHILMAASRALNRTRARISAVDFEFALRDVREGDVVYLDPPYVPISLTSNFTSYTAYGFDPPDQIRLGRIFDELVARGALAILTNSDTDETRRIYGKYRPASVEVGRAISSVATGRGKIRELVVIGRRLT